MGLPTMYILYFQFNLKRRFFTFVQPKLKLFKKSPIGDFGVAKLATLINFIEFWPAKFVCATEMWPIWNNFNFDWTKVKIAISDNLKI